MARASFTLKRYLPLNTETASESDWAVYGGSPASGASGTGASATAASAGLFGYPGGQTFDIIIKATSSKWVPVSNTNGLQVLCWSGTLGTSQSFIWSINDPSAAVGPSGFRVTIDANSQTGSVSSTPLPFVDGETYWVKFSFNHATKTGSFYYASDSVNEPTSWTSLANAASTLSNLTSFTSFSNHTHTALGFYSPNKNLADNNFDGTIYRAIVRTAAGESTQYYYYTGSATTFTVPTGVTSVKAILWGGGRTGGQVFGDLSVSQGEVLTLRVGGQNNGATGGWPNGGNGGTNSATSTYGYGGCGASDIKSGSTVLMVAGGKAGGPNSNFNYNSLGNSGALGGSGSTSSSTETAGTFNGLSGSNATYGGKGGTQTAAGAAGASDTSGRVSAPTAGSGQQGGNGASTNVAGKPEYVGGGGGGGYWGGGGGGNYRLLTNYIGHEGGGGSSYVDTSRVSNYKVSRRLTQSSTLSWYAVGSQVTSTTSFTYIPPIITDTTDNLSMTQVYGPPQPDYTLSKFDGLIVLRYTG